MLGYPPTPLPPRRPLRPPTGTVSIVSRQTREPMVEGEGGLKMGSKVHPPPSTQFFSPPRGLVALVGWPAGIGPISCSAVRSGL